MVAISQSRPPAMAAALRSRSKLASDRSIAGFGMVLIRSLDTSHDFCVAVAGQKIALANVKRERRPLLSEDFTKIQCALNTFFSFNATIMSLLLKKKNSACVRANLHFPYHLFCAHCRLRIRRSGFN
jgi:hypothetical protein